MDKFGPTDNYKHKFKELKKLQRMMCMDKKDFNNQTVKINLWGRDENPPHQRLEFSMVACQPNTTRHGVPCLQGENTFDETLKYLKAPELTLIYSRQVLEIENFDATTLRHAKV